MSNLVFHWKSSGSGTMRGEQVAHRLGAQYQSGEGTHIYVKMQPPEVFPAGSYLDVVDGRERMYWLGAHPSIGVIACSRSGLEYMNWKLGRTDVVLIPIHHCNFERIRKQVNEVRVAGTIGGGCTIQGDESDFRHFLGGLGLQFDWRRKWRGREDVAQFYEGLDVQIIWRKSTKPWKNPLKITNAMSYGIPTVAYPEPAFKELDDYYWPAETLGELADAIGELRRGFDAQRLIDKAEEYHIDAIAKLYVELGNARK